MGGTTWNQSAWGSLSVTYVKPASTHILPYIVSHKQQAAVWGTPEESALESETQPCDYEQRVMEPLDLPHHTLALGYFPLPQSPQTT